MTSELVKRLREAAADYTIAWGNGDLYEQAADELDRLTSAAPAEGVNVREAALEIVRKHRRHVTLSPGAGADCQRYAFACMDDIESDITALPIDAATERWVCVPREPTETIRLAMTDVMANTKWPSDWSVDTWEYYLAPLVYKAAIDAAMLAQSSPQKTGDKS
jgi:hypothetical protein